MAAALAYLIRTFLSLPKSQWLAFSTAKRGCVRVSVAKVTSDVLCQIRYNLMQFDLIISIMWTDVHQQIWRPARVSNIPPSATVRFSLHEVQPCRGHRRIRIVKMIRTRRKRRRGGGDGRRGSGKRRIRRTAGESEYVLTFNNSPWVQAASHALAADFQ